MQCADLAACEEIPLALEAKLTSLGLPFCSREAFIVSRVGEGFVLLLNRRTLAGLASP